jgi:hypothetical protein
LRKYRNAELCLKRHTEQLPVAHACNPSYLGGKDQEDQGSKPDQEIVHETRSWKTHHKKRAGGVAQVVRAPA